MGESEMSAAIHTRYGSGARGSYIRAWTKDGKGDMALRLPYPHELHHARRHQAAAKALAERLGWSGLWIVGKNDDNSICAVQWPCLAEALAPDHLGIDGEDYFFVPEASR
jgi:hypothetical protein